MYIHIYIHVHAHIWIWPWLMAIIYDDVIQPHTHTHTHSHMHTHIQTHSYYPNLYIIVSQTSNDACYDQLNIQGQNYGNCGAANGAFISCPSK